MSDPKLPADNPSYDKLRRIMWETSHPGEPMYSPSTSEIKMMYETIDHLLDAIWPEIEARNELIRELTDFAKEQGADLGLFIEEWEENGKLEFIQLVEDLDLYGL